MKPHLKIGDSTQRRILFVVPTLGGGGAERMTIDLANAISERGHGVTIATTGSMRVLRSQVHRSVTAIELAADGVMAAIPRLVRTIRHIQPDVIVSIMDHTNLAVWLASAIARASATLVFTTHVDFRFAFQGLRAPLKRLVLRVYQRVYRQADLRIAVSEGVAQSISTVLSVPRRHIEVVHDPAVTARLFELSRCAPPSAITLQLDTPMIVASGRLVAQKDFATLLRAVAIARVRAPMQVVILGEGPLRRDLAQLAEQLGLDDIVQMPGFVENPYALLSRARVFVSSSQYEGFGIAIVEAMALGVPVVATDCPSGPAEILGGGRYGRLVRVGDPIALAEAMIAALREPGPIAAARTRAEDFAVGTIADRYLELVCRSNT